MSPLAIAVVGPTGSGKSALAHDVAKVRDDVEIICVDSMTVYRGMDIGTSKPSLADQHEVRYHLVDLVDAGEEFSVAEFQRAARASRETIAQRGHHTIFVGGTGLYGRAVLDNLEIPAQYPEIRRQLEVEAVSNLADLYEELQLNDPVAAQRMESTNARRIIRALEVLRGSGRSFSSYGPGLSTYPPSAVIQIGLEVELEVLDRRIDERFLVWMEEGLLEEVRRLDQAQPAVSRTARQAVGYRELFGYLRGESTLDQAVAAAQLATRRLARRQLSWFRRDPRIEWFADTVGAQARVENLLHSNSHSWETGQQ
ncbi:MAG: tRNA (adenosine(37)-N6)-dimethylallyltransferase MiaA [Actinomycetota bacterium]